MQGKEAILLRISEDANKSAQANLHEAQSEADAILAEAQRICDEHEANGRAEQESSKQKIRSRAITVAALDAKKLVLAAKNAQLDAAFSRARNLLLELPYKTYKKLIQSMLQNASEGDVLTLSEKERKLFAPEELSELAKKRKIKISDKNGAFLGGVILSGGGVDKNMTLECEIALLRGELEDKVAKMLFSEGK
jgi:V/A-type H+-transporting ATPase subunit E